VDEMGTSASLAPLYTCSLRGRRAYAFALPSTYEQRAEHDAFGGALRPRGWGGVW